MSKREKLFLALIFVGMFSFFAIYLLSVVGVIKTDTETIVGFGLGSLFTFLFMLMVLDFILDE